MCRFRDFLIFLAGAAFFHTLNHIMLPYVVTLPFHTKFMVLTATINLWAIGISALITLLLLWWACKLGHKKCDKGIS